MVVILLFEFDVKQQSSSISVYFQRVFLLFFHFGYLFFSYFSSQFLFHIIFSLLCVSGHGIFIIFKTGNFGEAKSFI